jgi:hypothetical protein
MSAFMVVQKNGTFTCYDPSEDEAFQAMTLKQYVHIAVAFV